MSKIIDRCKAAGGWLWNEMSPRRTMDRCKVAGGWLWDKVSPRRTMDRCKAAGGWLWNEMSLHGPSAQQIGISDWVYDRARFKEGKKLAEEALTKELGAAGSWGRASFGGKALAALAVGTAIPVAYNMWQDRVVDMPDGGKTTDDSKIVFSLATVAAGAFLAHKALKWSALKPTTQQVEQALRL